MIITGGENVYPIEVESILAEHPSVAEVAVVGVPDKRWGESVTAVVKLVDGADVPSVDELIAFSTAKLRRTRNLARSISWTPYLATRAENCSSRACGPC